MRACVKQNAAHVGEKYGMEASLASLKQISASPTLVTDWHSKIWHVDAIWHQHVWCL